MPVRDKQRAQVSLQLQLHPQQMWSGAETNWCGRGHCAPAIVDQLPMPLRGAGLRTRLVWHGWRGASAGSSCGFAPKSTAARIALQMRGAKRICTVGGLTATHRCARCCCSALGWQCLFGCHFEFGPWFYLCHKTCLCFYKDAHWQICGDDVVWRIHNLADF